MEEWKDGVMEWWRNGRIELFRKRIRLPASRQGGFRFARKILSSLE